MDVRQMVITDYQERVAMRDDIPSELKRALKSHERVPLFVDNLTREINKIPEARAKAKIRRAFKMDRMKLKNIVYDLTDIFINNVKAMAEQKAMSEAEQERLRKKTDDIYGLDAQGNGVVEELGVEVKDNEQEIQN